MNAYAGQFLTVDLTNGKFEAWAPDERLYKDFLGGRGFGAKLLYDLLPPGTDPLSPENVFMILTGPLTGTIAPGATKYVVVTRSPATRAFLDTYSSGRIAIELKFAGYDGLIIRGKAAKPSYLKIEDDKVELLDAADLWGKDTFEAEEILQNRHGTEFGFALIGPAGENLVKMACVNSDFYRQAGRGGAGAVMGSKSLKAIAVRGTGSIAVHDIDGMLAAEKSKFEKVANSRIAQLRNKYGTPMTMNITNKAGMLPTRNFQTGYCPEAVGEVDGEGIEKITIATRGCYSCINACGKVVKIKFGPFEGDHLEGPEYESAAMLGPNWGVSRSDAVTRANIICDKLGLDTISAGTIIGFMMECYEKGLVTREEVNGYELKFGNYAAGLSLIEDIAYRRGVGDLLAEGLKTVTETIGKGSENFAMQVKNLEFPAYDPRGAWGAALTYALNPRGACHRRFWPPLKEVLGNHPPHTLDGKPALAISMFDENTIFFSLLVCDFPGKFIPVTPAEYAEYLSAGLGRTITERDLFTIAERIEHQVRLFNLREGFSRKDDRLPERILSEPLPDGPAKGLTIGRERFEEALAEYYRLRGWDENGVPTPETLARYGLTGGDGR